MPAGLHIVRKLRNGKPAIWYVYAWRGGPCIHRQEGGQRPAVTATLTDKAAEARRELRTADDGTLATLIAAFKAPTTPEWNRLAPSTRATWTTWLDRIREEFGDTPLRIVADRRFRGDVLDWRDRWINQPRSADMAIQTFSRLLSFGVDRARITTNVLTGIDQLYEFDRSDVIWEPRHFDMLRPHASVEVMEGVELAAATGLRRGDLVRLPWTAIGEHAIIWRTSKSRGRNLVTIPLLPETRKLLDRIRTRHAAAMARQRPNRRKPLPETVLSNSRWQPWQPGGFGSRFNDAKRDSGLDLHLHDVRGTFATRCMIAGLTDQEIADILGWSVKEVAAIRVKYVDQARVVVAIGERIARASV
ncbi:tyrosine-type recombinase/integrase [Stakelama tenebrarum]|uniref:Tyrosine-type recombinase/integrase n=1 Tax=Stakelama tenebrarum TaxID=2711215 RepID=A0A6G6Y4W9_9SPHN|nr:tyrosine-type recombinase/integrase [Sphingosinithalassobacter tenebrarum]QIG79950.1 tyrosine-type recombinase/integrase [Sphingosinithalassobacter tenebrarum]